MFILKIKQPGDPFLSNIEREFAEIVKQAGLETEFNVWTEDNATDQNGTPLPQMIALYTSHCYRDHGPFWKRYSELKRDIEEPGE